MARRWLPPSVGNETAVATAPRPGSAGKQCGDATAPAVAASVPDLNTDSGAERFTIPLADVADGVEQIAGLLGTGQGAVAAEPPQRRQRLVGPGHLQVGHRDQMIQAEQLEEDAGPVRAAQRAGETLFGLPERLGARRHPVP